jgi:hypothetical protein
MWGQANNEYAVLSTSPLDVSDVAKRSSKITKEFEQVPHLCHHFFDEE